MSESSKMGLFGSKDDNTETTDENKEPVKSDETLHQRQAPYNIDSDSETYDTEALSIMDINDIIGIQAESASDSTLESEFAALSEVITDMKSEELASGMSGTLKLKKSDIGKCDRSGNVDSTEDKGSKKEDPHEDICKQIDDNKSSDSAGMAGINKSLQLIGEAYISEDSQETDINEIAGIGVTKSVNLSESLSALKNQGDKAATKNSGKTLLDDSEKIEPEQNIAVECSAERKTVAALDKPVETVIKPIEEERESVRVDKSADSIDSPATDVSTKQTETESKTESMDVASVFTQDVAESSLTEKSTCNKSEESETREKIETQTLPVKTVIEAEEPMEIDEPNEEVSKVETEKVDSAVTEEIVENKSRPADPVVAEEATIEAKTSPKPEICEESSNDQVLKASASDFGMEEAEAQKMVNEELVQSTNSSKDEEISARKLQMETDESQPKESLAEKVETNSPVAKIVESLVETVEQTDIVADDNKPKTLLQKENFKQEMSPERVEQISEIKRHDILLVERAKVLDNEPMEVDDNARYHKNEIDNKSVNASDLSINYVDIIEPVIVTGDIVVQSKQSASKEPVDTGSNSRMNSSKNIEAAAIEANESAENETIVISSVTSDETSVASELSDNSAKIVDSILVVASKESASNKSIVSELEAPVETAITAEPMEIEDVTLKDNSKEELVVSVPKVIKKSLEVAEAVSNIIQGETSSVASEVTALEDEKMEVDAGVKKKKEEDESSDIHRPDEASQELESSSVSVVQQVSAVEEKLMIEKAGDTDRIENTENEEKTIEETVKIPRESMVDERREIETAKSIDETDETRQESKEKENVFVSERSDSSTEKSTRIKVTKATPEATNETAEDKENSMKLEAKETNLLISTEAPDKALKKNLEEHKTVLQVSIEKAESLSQSDEIKTPETPVAITEQNVEGERDELAAITKEEEKEAPVSIKKNIESEKEEKEEAETSSTKSPMPEEDSPKRTREIKSTETTDEPIFKDMKDGNEEIDSESTQLKNKSSICTAATAEVLEKLETNKTQEEAEESSSITLENETKSHFVFSKPEAPQQETSRSDLLSSSMNVDDIEGEEDPVEEEMNLSLDPDNTECEESGSQEDGSEEAQRNVELSLEGMSVDAKKIEKQVDINLSLDSEGKGEELSRVQEKSLEKLIVDGSANETTVTFVAEKPEVEDDDNSKDILSTMIREPEIFHDEQSQNTQEMMDSILETDSCNFNKILDDEEGASAAFVCANDLPLEEAEINELADKLPSESEELLNKALDDPMSSQNTDSLEGLLDLDLIQEEDESTLKSVDPIVAKVMNEAEDDEEIERKDVDVSLLLEETNQGESVERDGFADISVNAEVAPKVVEEAANEISTPDENLLIKSTVIETIDSPTASQLVTAAAASVDNDIEATFELPSIEPNPLEADPLTSEERKLELTEDLLREIAVDEEKKMELSEKLLLESTVEKDRKIESSEELFLKITIEKQSNMNLSTDLLLQTAVKQQIEEESSKDILLTAAIEAKTDVESMEKVLMESPVPEDPKIELSEDILLEKVVRDEVSNVAAEIEDLPPNSEISELESAVKFLQESEEQGIDSSLVLSPKIVDSVVDEITRDEDVEMFVTDEDICEDSTSLVAELGIIIPDPIAISEAEIISEAAKLENERKTKLSEEAKIQSPFSTRIEERKEDTESTPPPLVAQDALATVVTHPETPKTHREPRETVAKSLSLEKVEQSTLLKKSAPIPKISILEERLKEPPKIEIPSVSEVPRMCEMPTTPKTSLLIERDAKFSSFQKMLESPKPSDKSELKIVENPRKDADKHEFENVGSPRIILKIAKSAIADCGEPRSPKSPKIRSATNSPNPEDSPGQKLGKIKLKLSKSGHPSIISNDNVEEVCGQWYTEGTSSLSPLGMKIKFSKTGDASIVQTEKHEFTDETKEQPKHKFEEAKRTESPIGMKIKFSKTGDASIVQQEIKETTSKHKDKLEIMQGSPKRNESPIGMKIKFSKSGDASIIQPEKLESSEDHREGNSRVKDKLEVPQDGPRRTESPLGMKFKLSKTRGSASIIPTESNEDVKDRLEVPDVPKRTESPLGMKIKFSKTGDASIIQLDDTKDIAKHKERAEGSQESAQHSDAPIGVKIKLTKTRDASTLQTDVSDEAESVPAVQKRTESSIGMKFKLSKSGDASIVHSEIQEHVEDSRSKEKMDNPQETPRKLDSPIGMKIKFSKTGDASIIQPQSMKKSEEPLEIEKEHQKLSESAPAMKIKSQRSGEASVADSEKRDKTARRKETDSPLEMKIKLSKTGHPTIVACDSYGESSQRGKDTVESIHKHKESTTPKEMPAMKMLKSMHGNRTELTIEPVQLQGRKSDGGSETAPKRKDMTISSIESKKAKLEAKFSQILPEVTIQPIMQREQKQIMFDAKASSISRQQMNVISQEISITQVRSKKTIDLSMTDKLKNMLVKKASGTNANADCEIIEHRPELIIVNENSNSSQDVMIIEEVPAMRGPDVKVPKKRGRPRRNPLPLVMTRPMQQAMMPTDATIPRDPLALDDVPQLVSQMTTHMIPQNLPPKENERPKRSCSRQKSYAPPRRGRGRGRGGGRGKRKMEMDHTQLSKKPRIDQDLDLIEQSTTALITIDEPRSSCDASQPDNSHSTSELYKALRQPPMDHKMANAIARVEAEQAVNDADLLTKDSRESLMESKLMSHLDGVIENAMNEPIEPQTSDTESKMNLESLRSLRDEASGNLVSEQMEKIELMNVDEKIMEKAGDESKDNKDTSNTQDHQNWLTPSSKKQLDVRNEGNNISSVQVIDEETRMSAESNSRSQTPARNLSLQPPETIVNEESQGSVLSTATTESEKVKVKNRRMEINFDPDEGPFTVDKVAEYEWPPDPTRKSETFMIQEQISHYLGVKSFKRKYPDLKRRMVDMEERNYLRENALVSEAMCDMGLTAVSSSEVLDVMCNDFPDQYEEYRKYIREKQMKEHSKKQKELTAAANAERNRIDLAEMAVQSALSWNVGLNKARRESRKCSLDLQTFTIHVPKKQQKVEEESRQSHYPVTLIPGQYTDYYREYTPAELRYYPLNTVLYGPMKPNERKLDSQSEGSQSDSDSDSSSDDSSSSSSDGTQDTEESQSTMDEVDVELSRQKEDIKSIKCKMCLKHLNKFSKTEVLIQCGTCNGYVHPSCIDLTLDMVPHIQAYAWQCTDCKTCAQCHDPADEDKMLFCDMCDRGYHIYCVGLRRVPQGRWHCQECAVCASCGSREAGGTNSDRNSVAQWQHEYKKGDKNTRVYVSTLCVPCSKLCGDQGSDNRPETLSV